MALFFRANSKMAMEKPTIKVAVSVLSPLHSPLQHTHTHAHRHYDKVQASIYLSLSHSHTLETLYTVGGRKTGPNQTNGAISAGTRLYWEPRKKNSFPKSLSSSIVCLEITCTFEQHQQTKGRGPKKKI